MLAAPGRLLARSSVLLPLCLRISGLAGLAGFLSLPLRRPLLISQPFVPFQDFLSDLFSSHVVQNPNVVSCAHVRHHKLRRYTSWVSQRRVEDLAILLLFVVQVLTRAKPMADDQTLVTLLFPRLLELRHVLAVGGTGGNAGFDAAGHF